MKKIIFSIVLTMSACLVMAQGFGPQAGDVSLSLQLGRAENLNDVQYLTKNQSTYSIYAPSNSSASTNSNSLINMIGVEGKYYLSSSFALRLSGMGLISNTPAQQDIPGVPNPNYDPESGLPSMSIPNYADVPSSTRYQFVGNLGADYLFSVGNDRIYPYVGGQLNGSYSQRKDFTLVEDDLGERVSETYGLGGSVVTGVDYYVAQGFFLGIEIKAFSYMYSVNRIFPQPGMEAGDADNHTIGIFSNPMFKVGFTF